MIINRLIYFIITYLSFCSLAFGQKIYFSNGENGTFETSKIYVIENSYCEVIDSFVTNERSHSFCVSDNDSLLYNMELISIPNANGDDSAGISIYKYHTNGSFIENVVFEYETVTQADNIIYKNADTLLVTGGRGYTIVDLKNNAFNHILTIPQISFPHDISFYRNRAFVLDIFADRVVSFDFEQNLFFNDPSWSFINPIASSYRTTSISMLGDCGSPQDFVIYKRERFGSDELHYTRSPDFVTDVICKVGSRTNSNEVVRAIPYPLILDFDVTKDYCDHNDTTVMVQMCAGDDMVDASIGWSDILPYIEEYQDHIDSMTVEIIGGPSWARLEDNSPQLITQRYNDQRLTLSNDGDSSIEDFRRAILGTEISGFDGPFNGTIEVQFQLFSYIRRSLPASLFIDISTEIIEAGRDTSVTFCPLDVPQDLNNYLSAEAQMGQWVQGPIYDPQQDDPGEYDYVVRGNFCPEDTVHITVQLYPEATVDRQVFSLCPGDSILYAGQYYDEETTLLDTIYAIETGCDSLYNTVEIIELNQALIIESDTLLCNGEVLMISGQDISTPGIYSDTIRNNSGCDSLITQVTLSFAPQVQEVFIDTTICSGSNIIVGERIIDVGITDIFSVAGASGCDSITYNINVLVNEVEEIMIDTVLCLGESIEIQDEVYNETTDESIVLTDVNGCDSLIYILRIVEDIEQFLYQEYEVTTDEPTVISIDYNGSYNSILWIPQDGLSCVDCLEPELKITEDKIYNVEIENTIGCIDIIEVAVFAMEVTQPPQNAFYLPNVISTSDSGNDKFFLQSAASKSMTYSMSIYDRWGSEVFRVEDIQSNDATAGWDGISYNGAELLQGVYVYKIVLEDGSIVSGDILVLR